MRTRLLVSLFVPVVLLTAACGSSAKPSSTPTTGAATGSATTVHVAKEAGTQPSVSAKMVCEKEAVDAIYNSATGVHTVSPPKASWDVGTHTFSCVYAYPGGATMTLSVKEMSSTAETDAYYNGLASRLGKLPTNLQIGQGAFQAKDGSVVVRKDYKVLLVDITKLPPKFGVPIQTRGDTAINVAEAILGCWTGA